MSVANDPNVHADKDIFISYSRRDKPWVDDYLRPNGGIIFPNPNAPTGCFVAVNEVERLLRANTGSVVVIDEAYVDFGGESVVPLVSRYPQLLVTHRAAQGQTLAGQQARAKSVSLETEGSVSHGIWFRRATPRHCHPSQLPFVGKHLERYFLTPAMSSQHQLLGFPSAADQPTGLQQRHPATY